jgi:hypothetical protein
LCASVTGAGLKRAKANHVRLGRPKVAAKIEEQARAAPSAAPGAIAASRLAGSIRICEVNWARLDGAISRRGTSRLSRFGSSAVHRSGRIGPARLSKGADHVCKIGQAVYRHGAPDRAARTQRRRCGHDPGRCRVHCGEIAGLVKIGTHGSPRASGSGN